jgi:hypothetical protein
VAEITRENDAPQLTELSPRLGEKGEFLDAAVALATGETVAPGELVM